MDNIKQVLIIRTDLNMRKGKMIAQGSHASMKVFFERMDKEHNLAKKCSRTGDYDGIHNGYGYICDFTDVMIKWMEGSFTKIVVGCDSEQELFHFQKQAEEAGIVNAYIQDNGETEFKEICPKCSGLRHYNTYTTDGKTTGHDCDNCNGTGKVNKPTYTCLAIGPDYSDKIDKITGHLKLL